MSGTAPTTRPAAALHVRIRSMVLVGLALLLAAVDTVAALLLTADLVVVSLSVCPSGPVTYSVTWNNPCAR